ncbi:MAG: alpha/beta hydrolase [Erysipelotrichaceae bacterium]|nr:alpha/beta hydrolase [Erysipelotrichaceae bacterium]MDY5252669.1 alpha/beta fold hydrolase [Erysipelotrichaceae bacterium]
MKRKIKSTVYRPKTEIKGAVLIIHGMCEHRKRYDDYARFLALAGYGVITYDQVGHGESIDDVFGYFGMNGWSHLVEVADGMVDELYAQFPNVPHFIFAHSMGSIVARSYIKRHDEKIDGLILSGAPCYQKLAKAGLAAIKIIVNTQGAKNTSKHLKKLVEGRFNDEIKDAKSEADWISFDRDNIDRYLADPYCNQTFTNQGYHDLITGMIDMHDHKHYQHYNPALPILFVAGKHDPCTGYQKGLEDSIATLKKAGYKNIQAITYENSRHEVLNDHDASKVYHDTLTWLNAKQ